MQKAGPPLLLVAGGSAMFRLCAEETRTFTDLYQLFRLA
jgi:hypothetical protein